MAFFSRNKLSADIVHAFVRRASQEFRFAEITLNYANELPVTEGIMSETRNNFTLALNGHYRQIADGYSDSFNKNLKRARNLNLSYGRSGDFSAVIKLYMKLYGQRLPYFLHDDYMNFENLCASKTTEQNLFIRTVTSKERILAVALFLISGKRMYNMISCNTDEGRAFEANYLLYDQVIMEFANRNLVLDFEGSDVQGIADFYKRMGPSPEAYTFLKWNRLHPVMKLFKK